MFVEAIETILRDRHTPQVVRTIEAGGDPSDLWSALADPGFLELMTPADAGGGGLGWAELYPVLVQFGRHAQAVPAAQAIVARALLPAGQAPAGLLTLAPALERLASGAVACPLVPFGQTATFVLAGDDQGWLVLDARRAHRTPAGVRGSPLASLAWDDCAATWAAGDGPLQGLRSAGLALHAALIAGALARVLELTLQHCRDRSQFGRPVGAFQAVQQQLAVMAEQVAAAALAAGLAFPPGREPPTLMAAAVAKARTSEAAQSVAATAHALLGAMGVTAEHDLQLYTRRLHEWRMACGAEDFWHRHVGRAVLAGQDTAAAFVQRL